MRKVGLLDRKEDQKMAEELYQNCRKSALVKASIASADKALAFTTDSIDKTIISMKTARDAKVKSIEDIKGSAGCGSGNVDPTGLHTSQMCCVFNEVEEDLVD